MRFLWSFSGWIVDDKMPESRRPVFLQLTIPLLSCQRYPFEWIGGVMRVGKNMSAHDYQSKAARGAHPMKIFIPVRCVVVVTRNTSPT